MAGGREEFLLVGKCGPSDTWKGPRERERLGHVANKWAGGLIEMLNVGLG